MKEVECWQVVIADQPYLFKDQADANLAVAVMTRGAMVTCPANPHRPQAKIQLNPVEAVFSRVSIPVPTMGTVNRALGKAQTKGLIK